MKPIAFAGERNKKRSRIAGHAAAVGRTGLTVAKVAVNFAAAYAWDGVGVAGFVVVVAGVWEIHAPTAKILAGGVLVTVATLISKPTRPEPGQR